MPNFAKYKSMHADGVSPRDAYLHSKAAGLDEISSVRMLREVYGLTLVEAKKCTCVSDVWDQPQQPEVGNTVYWEGTDTVRGPYVMKAVVKEFREGYAYLTDYYEFRIVDGKQFISVPAPIDRIPLAYFQKSLVDRLQESSEFWQQLTALPDVLRHELPFQVPLNPPALQ